MVIHCIFRDTSGLISLVVCVLYIYSTIFQVVPEVRRFVFNRSVCRDVDTCLAHVYKNGIYIYIYLSKTYTGKPTFVFFQYSSLDNESYTCIPETGYKQKTS